MSNQVRYYQKNKINPVDLSLDNHKKIESHKAMRKKLLLEILKIPFDNIQEKTLIEFGPNGGENSLIFAQNGFKLFFKEPNIDAHKNINQLYDKCGFLNSINIEEEYLNECK